MSKNISDRCNVSAYVILDRKHAHVATVRALYGSGGTVHVEIYNLGDAVDRCLDTAIATGRVKPEKLPVPDGYYCTTPEVRRHYAASELYGYQRGRAGGYGYDKKTAALAGLIVDGHTLADHCGSVPEDENKRQRLLREYAKNHATRDYDYWRKRAERIGASWANYDRDSGRYRDLYFRAGLDRLSDMGYSVIFAI